MSQITVNIRYIVTKNSRSNIETRKAKIDTSARVDDFLEALRGNIRELGSRGQQLFLSVDPEERLDNLGLREGDTIVVMPRATEDIIIFEK